MIGEALFAIVILMLAATLLPLTIGLGRTAIDIALMIRANSREVE